MQSAYQIIAVNDGGAELWDSGKVLSGKMTHIEWDGSSLNSRDNVQWKVRVWDENDVCGEWSENALFEIGLLHKKDWIACWISGNYKPYKKFRYPVDSFLQSFNCVQFVRKARLYITACGVYEAQINGTRVGNFILAPGFTDYRKRLQYQTYDVTPFLRPGENNITVELADGWYRGSIGAMGITYFYGMKTKLLIQMEITYSDGSVLVVTSGEDFRWSSDGPVRFADMKDGEIVDLKRQASHNGQPRLESFPGILCSSNNVPVTEHERFMAKLIKSPSGKTLLDFGQNISGYIEFTLNARNGQKISLQMAEKLKDGELDMASIQCRAGKPNATPQQKITVICTEGQNHYKTKFAVFGFRYAEVTSDFPINAADFSAIAVYSDMEETGFFDCSNALLNRLVENTRWSMKGNFLDVPTDCPTRERAGWTGDAQVFCKSGTWLMDTAAFFRKWLRDLRDRQTKKGKVHCIVPSVGNEGYISAMDGCCGWADAAVLVPYRLYEMYGDSRLLEESYYSMKNYFLFQINRTGRTGLFGKPVFGPDRKYISNTGQAFGEWLEPQDVYRQSIIKDFIAPHPEEATAYLSWIAGHLAVIARVIGHMEDIPLYEEYKDGCKRSYNNRFVKDGCINSNRQAKFVRPLAMGLLEGETKAKVFSQLIGNIEHRDYHIGTGFLSTPLILPLLSVMGRSDIAYKMLENTEAPGWLYPVKNGATTIWEDWEGRSSQNHYSYGSVCEWIFETVCGLQVAGDNHFKITPIPGGTLTHAKFSYNSVYGYVESHWKSEAGKIQLEVTVPANCTAVVRMPNGDKYSIQAGKHTFDCKSEKQT
jgi:alpha-L-rhamnosidase